jgi:hypothetical protein
MVLFLIKFGLLFFIVVGNVAAISDTTLSTGCSSHCTLNFDKNLECWNKTLTFYQQTLVGGLRHYSNVLTNIAYWSKHNKEPPINLDEIGDETIARMRKIEPGNIEDEDAVIEPLDYTEIVKHLVTKSQKAYDIMTHENDQNPKPKPSVCPLGCEKSWDPWYWMFLASAGINIVLGFASMVFVWFLDKRDTEEARLELAECEIVKIQPKESIADKVK